LKILLTSLFIILCFIACKNNVTKEVNLKIGSLDIMQVAYNEEEVDVEFKYYGMMCTCPQWSTLENIEKYEKAIEHGVQIPMDSLFFRIQAANENTIDPFDLDYDPSNPLFIFNGRFSKKKQLWLTEGGTEYNCLIFQYSNCKPVIDER